MTAPSSANAPHARSPLAVVARFFAQHYKDALLTLLAVLYSAPAWAYPFGNDQGLHWYLGKRWLEGELPFVSGISSKPIGIFAVYSLTIGLLGDATWAIRVSEIVSVVGFGYVVALAATVGADKPKNGVYGLGALLFSFFYYTYFDYWDTAHPELWEGGCIISAFVVATHAQRPWARDAGVGALCMAAFMFKFPAALPGLVICLLCARRAIEERPVGEWFVWSVIKAGTRVVLGSLPVLVLVVLPFVIGGKLGPMWEVLYKFILKYREHATSRPGLPEWLRIDHSGGLVAIFTYVGSIGVAIWSARKVPAQVERGLWLFLTALLAFLSVVAQARYFGYHWAVVVPLVSAITLYGILAMRPHKHGLGMVTLLACVLIMAGLFYEGPRWIGTNTYRSHAEHLRDYLKGTITREEYLQHYHHTRLENPYPLEQVAKILWLNQRPGDTLCTRGFVAPLFQLTRMRCTTRHIVEDIVDFGLPGWRAEYAEAMRLRPPTFIVSFSDRPRDLRALEKTGYKRLGSHGLFVVYGKRPPVRPPPPKPRPKPVLPATPVLPSLLPVPTPTPPAAAPVVAPRAPAVAPRPLPTPARPAQRAKPLPSAPGSDPHL